MAWKQSGGFLSKAFTVLRDVSSRTRSRAVGGRHEAGGVIDEELVSLTEERRHKRRSNNREERERNRPGLMLCFIICDSSHP